MKTRTRALLMAVLMIISLLPVISFADDAVEVSNADDLKTNLAAGNSVVLTTDIDLGENWSCSMGDGAVLDGGNHKLTVGSVYYGSSAGAFYCLDGSVTVKNLDIELENGTWYAFDLRKGGTFENVTILGNFSMGICAEGDLTIDNCTFDNAGWGFYCEELNKTTAAITNSTFTGTRAAMLRGEDTFVGNTVETELGLTVVNNAAVVTDNTFRGDKAMEIYVSSARIENNNIYSAVTADVAVTLTGNYWSDAALADANVTTSGNLSRPVGEEPAPVYGGPAMNWVKVNAANNGVVKSGPLAASAGATITLYPKAAEGYVLDTVTVLDAEGNTVELDGLKFAVPAGGVTVSATFKLAD